MNVGNAEKGLKRMLKDAGVDPARPPLLETWNVFKTFAVLPVEGVGPDSDDDLLLFQWGCYDWGGKGERFNVDFLRQFTVYSRGGGYDHMEQLHCTFFFEPTPGLRALGSDNEWSGRSLDAWFAQIEELPAFTMPTQSGTPSLSPESSRSGSKDFGVHSGALAQRSVPHPELPVGFTHVRQVDGSALRPVES
jgi:hypothetical protein